MKAIKHVDGLHRCPWPKDDPLYVAYHDDEWGVPEYDDRALFEKPSMISIRRRSRAIRPGRRRH